MSNEPLKSNRCTCTCFIITYQCKVSWMWNDKAAVYWKRYQHKNITVPQWSHRYTCSGPWWYTTVWPSHLPVTSCRLVVCTAILHSPPTQGLYNSLVYLLIQQDWSYAIVRNPRSVLQFLNVPNAGKLTEFFSFLWIFIILNSSVRKQNSIVRGWIKTTNKLWMHALLI